MSQTKRASSDAMEMLHKTIVEQLTSVIKAGAIDKETGEHLPASAAYYSAAIKLLKDNNITGVISETSPLKSLLAALEESDILAEIEQPSLRH